MPLSGSIKTNMDPLQPLQSLVGSVHIEDRNKRFSVAAEYCDWRFFALKYFKAASHPDLWSLCTLRVQQVILIFTT